MSGYGRAPDGEVARDTTRDTRETLRHLAGPMHNRCKYRATGQIPVRLVIMRGEKIIKKCIYLSQFSIHGVLNGIFTFAPFSSNFAMPTTSLSLFRYF